MFWKKKEKKKEAPKVKKRSENYFFKIALLGDGATGKTSIRRRYLGQGFTTDHMMTIGADFAAHNASIKHKEKNYNIVWQIWDLAGQDSFYDVRNMYYKGCFGALLVFDRTRPQSFDNLGNWVSELKKHSGRGIIPVLILGNKYDLVDSADQVVSEEAINTYLKKIKDDNADVTFEFKYYDTSALTGLNIEQVFDELGQQILGWVID